MDRSNKQYIISYMLNMWSDKKIVNIIMNISLLLLSMNFLHLGQFFLPIMCLVLFIDNKFRFKVNNIKTFVILCLFAITFCAFSYKLGFYCVMGFCLPMAYYIGSNLMQKNENGILNIVYLIAIGMAVHCVLNFIYDLSIYGLDIFHHQSRYDIWLQCKATPTASATNMIIPVSCLYYVINEEKRTVYKTGMILVILLVAVYNLFLGRRIPVVIAFTSFVISYMIDIFYYRIKKIDYLRFFKVVITFVCTILFSLLIIVSNMFGIKDFLRNFTVFNRFINYGLNSGRLYILIDALKQLPYHLFGGQEIGNIIGDQIHETWLDIYDYAGIIPYVLFVAYTIIVIKRIIYTIKTSVCSNRFKLLIIGLTVGIVLQMFTEPLMTGSSIFLICSILIYTAIESIGG